MGPAGDMIAWAMLERYNCIGPAEGGGYDCIGPAGGCDSMGPAGGITVWAMLEEYDCICPAGRDDCLG